MVSRFFVFSAVFLFAITGVFAQQEISVNYTIMNQAANDMLYDSFASKILITIPDTVANTGNSIGFVNPDSAILTSHYFVGSSPSAFDMTGNGKYAYIGFTGASDIKKFNLQTDLVEQTIPLSSDNFFGPRFANSISCQPGNDSVFSVVTWYNGVSPAQAGTYIFSNGRQLTDSLGTYPVGMDVAHFYSASSLYGYNNESTGYDFFSMNVNNSGVTLLSDHGSLFSGFYIDFFFAGQNAISGNGTDVDISNSTPFQAGVFNLNSTFANQATGCYDPYMNLVCIAFVDFSTDSIYIKRYDPLTFLQKDQIAFGTTNNAFQNAVTKIICWGNNTRYAFSTNEGQIYIINGTMTVYNCPAINQAFTIKDNGALKYTFTDASIGPDSNAAYIWTINGATVSDSTGFQHTFTVPQGDSILYTICETISEPTCLDTAYLCRQLYISSKDTTSGCAGITQQFDVMNNGGATYTFTDSSKGQGVNAVYAWTINNVLAGNSPSLNNTFPVSNNNNYTVCEIISQPGCPATTPVCVAVTGPACPIVSPYFTYIDDDSLFVFTDASNGLYYGFNFDNYWSINGTPVSVDTSFNYNYEHVFTHAGTYNVCEYISLAGCGDTSFCQSITSTYTGIADINNVSPIRLYPNPASTEVTIDMANEAAVEIEIFDAIGRRVIDRITGSVDEIIVSLNGIPSGTYLASIHLTGNQVVHRIFVLSK